DISYTLATNGTLLKQASDEINRMFPGTRFTASWVFVATWEKMEFEPDTGVGGATFQVVLLSGDDVSVILMNYKHVDFTEQEWMTGYWTADGIHLFTINEASSSDLSTGSNVRTPGLWAFRVDGKSYGKLINVLALGNMGSQLKSEVYQTFESRTTELNLFNHLSKRQVR
uniref:NIDO domain-containing protein n=1 Tax=Astyanax mexicanus TaxID=7994 RepID=A0A8B9L3G5_ASTMX